MKTLLTLVTVLALIAFDATAKPAYQLIKNDGHEIHLLTFDPKTVEIILVKDPDNQRQTVRELAKQHHAYAGINGGFFADDEKGVYAAGALKIKGEWLKRSRKAAMGWKASDQKPGFGMANKTPAFEQADFVVGGIPLLLKNKQPILYKQEKVSDPFRDERHARTAVCVKQDGTWLWLVTSHSKAKDREHLTTILEGFTLKELTDFLLKQGCVDAINLDGGGSSTLVIEDKVMNQPAGDFVPLLNAYEERSIYDALLLISKE